MRRIATVGPLAAALAAVLAVVSACGGGTGGGGETSGGDELQQVTLTLNWVPYGEHAPFYYGVAKGIYEEEGIDLTIRSGSGSGTTVKLVASAETDFGWADTPALIHSVDTGMPVKSAGVFLQKGPASIEFFADKDIEEPADLEGMSVAGTPGDAMYQTFPAWLEANGVAVDAVDVVNVDPAGKIAALTAGRVDAIMGFFHDQAPTIEDKSGRTVDTLLYADWGMNLLGTGIVVNERTVQSDPELVQAFVRATQKAWTEAADNPADAAQIMAADAEQAPPEEVLVEQLEKTIGLLNLDAAPSPGVNTARQWEETIGLLDKYADLEDAGDPATYWLAEFSSGG